MLTKAHIFNAWNLQKVCQQLNITVKYTTFYTEPIMGLIIFGECVHTLFLRVFLNSKVCLNMFSTSSFKLIFTKQLPLMAWRPNIKLLITVSLNKSHLSVMYILNYKAREQHIHVPKGRTWKLNNSLCNITILQAHIKCKNGWKPELKHLQHSSCMCHYMQQGSLSGVCGER